MPFGNWLGTTYMSRVIQRAFLLWRFSFGLDLFEMRIYLGMVYWSRGPLGMESCQIVPLTCIHDSGNLKSHCRPNFNSTEDRRANHAGTTHWFLPGRVKGWLELLCYGWVIGKDYEEWSHWYNHVIFEAMPGRLQGLDRFKFNLGWGNFRMVRFCLQQLNIEFKCSPGHTVPHGILKTA